MIIELLSEAVEAGARWHKACEVLELSLRTIQRWRRQPDRPDGRKAAAQKRVVANKLSDQEAQGESFVRLAAAKRQNRPRRVAVQVGRIVSRLSFAVQQPLVRA